MKNKILIVLLAVLAMVAVGYLIFSKNQINSQPTGTKVEVQEAVKNGLPKDFPSDIPLEAGAEVTINFNAINSNGEFQASREFISKKTVAENYASYQKMLKEKGWNITNAKENTPAGSLIFAEKSNYKLNIRIYTDATNKVRVSINNVVSK